MDELKVEDIGWLSMYKNLEKETAGCELEDSKFSATGRSLPRRGLKRKGGLQLGTKLTLTGCVTFYKRLPSQCLGLLISK